MTLAEIRFYTTGWVVRLGPLCLRWNRQDAYWSLSVERLQKGVRNIGGMTWGEFLMARRQAKEARSQFKED